MNCWFCNQNTVVPYGNRNCWDCPNCDQYNGFQEVSFSYSLGMSVNCSELVFFLFAGAVSCARLYSSFCCFQNGDYNKPIPAQYMEHLNHGVSGSLPSSETPKTLQWVNCQMLLCRKCNNNQSAKIKQLASFIPRDDVCALLFSIHYNTIFTVTMTDTTFIIFCFFFRRTTMRKLKPTSTTWSRPISYAGHVRQQWSTTSNIKTANFELCS